MRLHVFIMIMCKRNISSYLYWVHLSHFFVGDLIAYDLALPTNCFVDATCMKLLANYSMIFTCKCMPNGTKLLMYLCIVNSCFYSNQQF